MDSTRSTTGDASSKQHLWPRDQISKRVHQIILDQLHGASLNHSASEIGVPRSTVQIWMRNRARLEKESGLNPTAVEFFRITIKRSDRTTAANRFFGQEHRELFPWLLEHMSLPPRPRRKI